MPRSQRSSAAVPASTGKAEAKIAPAVLKTEPGTLSTATAHLLPNLFAGTSGWAYATWKPGFYPPDVPSRAFLAFYASRLTSVEVNYTFRTLPTREQLTSWLAATPPHFRFSFKAPQRITHFERLANSAATLREFLKSIEPIRRAHQLGLVLFQLPPNFKADVPRLRAFLNLRALRSANAPKIAFEFRHASWFTDATYDLLRDRNAALCVAESEALTTPDIATATHRCYRLRHPGGYTARELAAFAARFATMAHQHETFVYFKHEDEPTGALNAAALLERCTRLASANDPDPSQRALKLKSRLQNDSPRLEGDGLQPVQHGPETTGASAPEGSTHPRPSKAGRA